MIICITGTPGTGKSTLAKALKKELSFDVLDVTKLVKEEKLYDEYDRKDKSYVVDTKKLGKLLIEIIKLNKKNLIIDSHLSHYLPKKYIDLCIVTKCELKELEKRLKKRKYSKQKIRDNLDSEIFDICKTEAEETGHKVIVIDLTKGIKKKDISNIKNKIR